MVRPHPGLGGRRSGARCPRPTDSSFAASSARTRRGLPRQPGRRCQGAGAPRNSAMAARCAGAVVRRAPEGAARAGTGIPARARRGTPEEPRIRQRRVPSALGSACAQPRPARARAPRAGPARRASSLAHARARARPHPKSGVKPPTGGRHREEEQEHPDDAAEAAAFRRRRRAVSSTRPRRARAAPARATQSEPHSDESPRRLAEEPHATTGRGDRRSLRAGASGAGGP
jgi:hypothetical protein